MSKTTLTLSDKEKAIASCIKSNQDPFEYIDYADLRNGKENWEYFLPRSQGGLSDE